MGKNTGSESGQLWPEGRRTRFLGFPQLSAREPQVYDGMNVSQAGPLGVLSSESFAGITCDHGGLIHNSMT
jgi:hypothetical protein